MASPPSPKARRTIRLLIVFGGLLLAVNVIIIAGVSQRTNSQPTLPTEIEELVPKPGDLISPEATIGVNLRNDLQGVLQLDGAEIPQDQVVERLSEGILTFSPGPGKEYSKLPQGSHRLTVVYWPRAASRGEGTNSYTWSFKVGA